MLLSFDTIAIFEVTTLANSSPSIIIVPPVKVGMTFVITGVLYENVGDDVESWLPTLMVTGRLPPPPEGVFAVTVVLEAHATLVHNFVPIFMVMIEVDIPKFVPINVVVTPPFDVLGFGEMDVMAGGVNDNNFGCVCVFDIPFNAVTLTTKLLLSPAGKLQIILVSIHDVGVHIILPILTVFVVEPV